MDIDLVLKAKISKVDILRAGKSTCYVSAG